VKNFDQNILANLFDGMLRNLKAVGRKGVIEKR
jgi:hypothetical protein